MGVNQAPLVSKGISDMTVTTGSKLYEIVLSYYFSDLDAGDSLTYTAMLVDGSSLPDWLQFSASHHDLDTMVNYFLPNGTPSTGSGSGPATDSASAGTAISTGVKTVDGNIAWNRTDSPGGELQTIAETLRAELGYAIGVASTVPFSHATPATFVSHDVSRNNYWDIAHEILFATQPEVVIGGGYNSTYFAKATKVDTNGNSYNDDYDAFNTGTHGTDYVFVQRVTGVDGGNALATAAEGVSLSEGEKLFGLFGTSGGNFEYYNVADSPGNPTITRSTTDSTPAVDEDPTLTEVTMSALAVLNQDDDGFFIMIEQGDIDWSNHNNDYENMVGGVLDLDRAVQAAEAYVESGSMGISWSNTLIIVTSDHSNSYLRAQEELGIGDLPTQSGKNYPGGEVTYGTGGHSNELVTLQARGAGAELFEEYAGDRYAGTLIVDNTQIHDVMLRAAQEADAEHIILFIGDGMNIEHEIAASRYFYGEDLALAWHDWGKEDDGWAGYASTWDVTAYNSYASAAGAPSYNEATFNPLIGYDPQRGGQTPYPLSMTFSGTPAESGVYEIKVTATDEGGATVSDVFLLTVTGGNSAPTMTAMSGVVQTTNEDTEVGIIFADVSAQGDESDIDGTVVGYVVKSVTSGTLRIGADSSSAMVWNAVTNNRIDASHNAYWTPVADANGDLGAFSVVAIDDDGAESATPVPASVHVTPVNDAPTMTAMSGVVQTTDEDTEVRISLADVSAQGDEADIDGTVEGYMVKSVASGTLRIGADSSSAMAWNAVTNNRIDASHNAYWTPAAEANGDLGAFSVVAVDDDGAESAIMVAASVHVTDNNSGATEGDDILLGSESDDVIFGAGGDDLIVGYGGNDDLGGGNGNDTLDGGSGNDSMSGGTGDDTYVVNQSGDVVTELFGEGIDLVQSSRSWTLGSNIENLELTGSSNLSGTGNTLANHITGNAGRNNLSGGSGNDTLDGGSGNDTMSGGTGDDTYVVSQSGDVVRENSSQGIDLVQSSVSWTLGSNIENLELTGSSNLNGTGNSLANIIIGNSGNNNLTGGAGADTLTGGAGNDLFDYNSTNESSISAMDVITDFTRGYDRMDLSGIDANSRKSGNQAFSGTLLDGSDAFTAAGQLRFDDVAGILYGNTDNDAAAEFAIVLSGITILNAMDFIL